jgi:hypothetical protein
VLTIGRGLKISNGGRYGPSTARPRSYQLGVIHVTSGRRLTCCNRLPRYAFSVLQVGVVPVTAGSRDQGAADGTARGYLRASHADREQVIGKLKAAFVLGMLVKDELDVRVGQAFASRTYADLAAITADLPAGLAAAQLPVPAQAQGEARIPRPGRVLAVATALTALYAGAWVYVLLSPNGGDEQAAVALIFWGGFLYLIVLLFAGAQILADRQDQRSGGQSPRLGGHRRQAVEGEQSSSPGEDLILCQAHRDARACRLLAHGVT